MNSNSSPLRSKTFVVVFVVCYQIIIQSYSILSFSISLSSRFSRLHIFLVAFEPDAQLSVAFVAFLSYRVLDCETISRSSQTREAEEQEERSSNPIATSLFTLQKLSRYTSTYLQP